MVGAPARLTHRWSQGAKDRGQTRPNGGTGGRGAVRCDQRDSSLWGDLHLRIEKQLERCGNDRDHFGHRDRA